jgi:nicotinate-nucleotide adenylyltransferase
MYRNVMATSFPSPNPRASNPSVRLGIFGGSFDPVHNGHLALAHAAQQQAGLDEVWFMPTATQPLKRDGARATNEDRVEMLRLATRDKPNWRVCTIEIDRGGLSYTVDTLRQLGEELPDTAFFFLIGSDALRDVARWKEPRELFRMATPLVVHRAGDPAPDLESLALLCTETTQPQRVEMPAMAISSTDIRRRCANGEQLGDLLPPVVADYIEANKIYSRGS